MDRMGLFLLGLVLLGVFISIKLFKRQRSSIPGPFQASVSPFYRIWLLLGGRGPIEYAKLHEKYGPVVRTGPRHVSLSDSAMISNVYDLKNKFLKSKFYDVFRPLYKGLPLDTVFTTQDVARNKRMKVALVKNMTGCAPVFQDEINNSVRLFEKNMGDMAGQSLDISYWSFYWSFDITFSIIFGCHFGYMDSRSDFNGWIYSFKTITSYGAMLGQIPELCPWTLGSNRVMSFLRRFQTFPDPTQEFIMEIEKRIKKHDMEPHICGKTVICQVLAGRDGSKDADWQHKEAVNVLFETFFAAAAEVAVTLGTVFYCLLAHKEVYSRLVTELRHMDHAQSKNLSAHKTPYLTAVIKESLRVYSSNSPPMERVVPPSGMTANGHHIPEGTIVSVPQFVAHRDVEVYGKDALDFRPERWLEADEASLKKMEHNFLAFGKGSRACVGRDLAMLELRLCLAGLLREFDVELTSKDLLPEVTMYWMIDHIGFNVRFSLAGV